MRPNYPNLNVARRRLEASVVRLGSTPIFIDRVVRREQPLQDDIEVRMPNFLPGHRYRNRMWWFTDFDGSFGDMPEWQRERLVGFENFEGDLAEMLRRENNATAQQVREHLVRQQQPRFEDAGEFRVEDFDLEVTPVGGRPDFTRVPMDDPRLNLIPVQLGMAREGGGAIYVERAPCRLYSQGLTVNNIRITQLGSDQRGGNFPLANNPDLSDCIAGKHPSLREALAEIAGSDDVTARPFDRHLAISVDHNLGLAFLWYKKTKIGWSDTGDKFKIAQPYAFMREYLTEKEVNHDLAA